MALSLKETEILRDRLYGLRPDVVPTDQITYQQARLDYLIAGEGVRQQAYDDGKGNITVGVGFNMDSCKSKGEWEGIFKGTVSFDAVYHKQRSLTQEEVNRLLEACLKARERALQFIYQGIWGKLRANERLAIESAYFNAPSLVMGPVDRANVPGELKLPLAKSTRFYGHMRRYCEEQHMDALKQAVIELRCHSNAERDPKIKFGLQQRRNSEAELLASYKV